MVSIGFLFFLRNANFGVNAKATKKSVVKQNIPTSFMSRNFIRILSDEYHDDFHAAFYVVSKAKIYVSSILVYNKQMNLFSLNFLHSNNYLHFLKEQP